MARLTASALDLAHDLRAYSAACARRRAHAVDAVGRRSRRSWCAPSAAPRAPATAGRDAWWRGCPTSPRRRCAIRACSSAPGAVARSRQFVDQLLRRSPLHALDRIGMRGEIERAAAVHRIAPHHAPALRRQRRALLGACKVRRDLAARMRVVVPGEGIFEFPAAAPDRAARRRAGSRRIRSRRHAPG